MKTCGKCKIEKELTEFHLKSAEKQTYGHWCKSCMKEYDKGRWKRVTPEYRQNKSAKQKLRIQKNWKLIFSYLSEHPCVDCGNNNPVVLEFDHIRDKVANISDMMSANKNMKLVFDEIEKCEVRCANCHRIKTADQLGYFMTTLK